MWIGKRDTVGAGLLGGGDVERTGGGGGRTLWSPAMVRCWTWRTGRGGEWCWWRKVKSEMCANTRFPYSRLVTH